VAGSFDIPEEKIKISNKASCFGIENENFFMYLEDKENKKTNERKVVTEIPSIVNIVPDYFLIKSTEYVYTVSILISPEANKDRE